MSIAAIKAGAAFYEVFAEDKTKEGLDSVEKRLSKIGGRIGMIGASMTAFAAAGLTAIGAMVKAFAGAGDNISDAMNVTGLSSDFLQTLQFAAADAGVAFDALVGAVTKSNKLLSDASAGGKKANATLSMLGLSLADLLALSPDERFKTLADAIDKFPDPAKRAAAAMAVFGKAGAKLLPALEGGMQSLNEQMADMKARGLIMSDEDRQLAARAEGAYLSLGLALQRVSQVIAAAAAPAFIAVLDIIQTVVESVVSFIDKNRTLVAGITIGLGVIGALGIVLMGIGGALIFVSAAMSGLAAAGTALGTILAVISSPLFLIAAAIIACGAAALVSAYYLDQLFNGGAALKALQDGALAAWEAIKLLWTAVANGRWDLAGQLISQGLTAGFYAAILMIKEAWNDLTIWLVGSIVDAMQRVESVLPKFARDRLQLGATGREVLETAKLRGEAGLADDRQRAASSALALADTAVAIRGLDDTLKKLEEKAADRGLADFGSVSRQMQQSSILSGSSALSNSSGIDRIGHMSPANSIAEKQLDALNDLVKGQDKLIEAVEELEGLTVE